MAKKSQSKPKAKSKSSKSKARSAPKPKPRIVPSQSMVAKHFGVSPRRVNFWINRPDPMPGERGNYNLDEIEQWRDRTFIKDKSQGAVEQPTVEAKTIPDARPQNSESKSMSQMLLEAKTRKETALADQNEIKAKKMDDEFIPIIDVNRWVTEFLVLQRKLLNAMPVEMFASAPDEIRKIYQPDLKARIDIHLNQMGDWIERVEDLKE